MASTQVVARGAIEPRATTGLWREAWGRLRKNKLAIVGLIAVSILMLAAVFGPMIAPYPYDFPDKEALKAYGFKPLPPMTAGHLLGTDQLGRDLLSRLLDGARISMTVALVVQFVVLFI